MIISIGTQYPKWLPLYDDVIHEYDQSVMVLESRYQEVIRPNI